WFGKKVAWITSGGPVEPLIAMGIIPVYPENHGAMIGASRTGVELCEVAESLGYSVDLCSYARADIGCAAAGGGPIGGLPRPDMLICGNNICGTVLKWYEIQARKFRVPLFIFDTPFVHTEFTREAKAYVDQQVQDYLRFLETVMKKRFPHDKMQVVGRRSVAAMRLWQQVLDTATARPAPLTAFDAFFHLALIVTLRGTKTVLRYYRFLLAELRERAARGIGVVANERYRFLWDNLPIWHRMRWLSRTFAARDAALVADTYTSAWTGAADYLDENDFLGTMGEAYARIYLNIGVDQMAAKVLAMIDKYGVDGLVMHSNRSCKPYSFGQYDIRRLVQRERGLPVLILESDMVDARKFSEAQVENRIDAFMEMVRQK
ncbi:MAG: 2-hydroxyacyl-CoA dehydratase, partial [Deltaproteobacteria bacterium]|nr:2-hydroxyacyl-CoA dehydratase [Deltaproteobacteria bacterium]